MIKNMAGSDDKPPGPMGELTSYDAKPGEKLGVLSRELLENYSKIPPGQVEDHVIRIVGHLICLVALY